MAQNRTNNTSTYPNRPLSSACHAATENANQSIRLGNRREGGNCRRPEVQGGPGHAGVARNQRQRAHVSTAPIPPRTRPPWPCPCASDPQRIRRGRPPAPPARTPPPNRAPPRRKSRPRSPSARQVSHNSFSIPSIRPSCCLPVHFLLLVKRASAAIPFPSQNGFFRNGRGADPHTRIQTRTDKTAAGVFKSRSGFPLRLRGSFYPLAEISNSSSCSAGERASQLPAGRSRSRSRRPPWGTAYTGSCAACARRRRRSTGSTARTPPSPRSAATSSASGPTRR